MGTVKLSNVSGLARVGLVRYLSSDEGATYDPTYAGYRFPAELIAYAVWLYFRFPLSLRMVEEMLAARGISVSYETIRRWSGSEPGIRQPHPSARPRAAATNGTLMKSSSPSPARSIGCGAPWNVQEGFVLDVLVQSYAIRRPPNACSASC